MDIQNRKGLQTAARERLSASQSAAKITLIYAAILVGSTLLTNLISVLVGTQISQFGGLDNLGFRSVLSTIRTMLPIILNFLLMCLSLGFTGTMLRISRKQYASPKGMKIGFDRFWVLLRATLIQGALYSLVSVAAFYLSMQLFLITPLSNGLMRAMAPLLESGAGAPELLADAGFVNSMTVSMAPLFILMIVVFLAGAAPIYYRYRMVNYLLLDKPGTGALAAMRESWMMTRGKCMSLFKLDLSLWWFYVATGVAMLICYGDMLLGLMGVNLPMSPTVSSFLFFVIYLVALMAITFFLQPHVEVTHALAYESLRPKEQPSGGVVLGNIFNM